MKNKLKLMNAAKKVFGSSYKFWQSRGRNPQGNAGNRYFTSLEKTILRHNKIIQPLGLQIIIKEI